MPKIVIAEDIQRKVLTPISVNNPAGDFLLYDSIYSTIRDYTLSDDTLPKGIWSYQGKIANWKKVFDLSLEALCDRSKDLQIAAWLTKALLIEHNLQGLLEGITLMMKLCKSFWPSIHPLIEDKDEAFRCSPLIWLNDKVAPLIRYAPTFYSLQTMQYNLPVYYYNLTQMNLTQGQEEQKEQVQQWKDGALSIPKDALQDTFILACNTENVLKEFSQWLDDTLQNESVSFHNFYQELQNICDGIEYMGRVQEESSKEKASAQENAPSAPPQTTPPEENTTPPIEEEPQILETEEAPTPEQNLIPDQPQNTPQTPPSSTIPATRRDVYYQMSQLIQTLKVVEPQSPLAFLLEKLVSYESLSFEDLMQKYDKKGALRRIQDILVQDTKRSS